MMKAKKFNLSLILMIPTIFAGYFIAVNFFYFDNKNDSFSIETYFNYKESLAGAINDSKILFTSGSNNFLGIRAYQIEEEFNVPTVNMSIHAGLGTQYILDRLKKTAKVGDVVIVPLEYGNFAYNGAPAITLNKYLLSYDKENFNTNYTYVDRLKMLSSISIVDLFYSIFNKVDSVESQNKREDFLKNINSNGDMLNMIKHDSLKTKKNPFKLPSPIASETLGLTAIVAFNSYCKENGISFFVTFPNIIDDSIYASEKYQKYFNFLLSYFKANMISVIGKPKDAMYPQELFFDSEYHLISKGSDIRTTDFIQLIRKHTKANQAIRTIAKNRQQNAGLKD